MKTKLLAPMMILLFTGTLVLTTIPVMATKPVEMNIIVTPGPTIFEVQPLPNGLVKVSFSTTQAWSGDWVGTNVQSGTVVGRSEDIGNLLSTIKASGVFTGTVDGPDGLLTGSVRHRMRNNVSPKKGGYFANTITLLTGTGDLAGIHGQGAVGEGWININVHFDSS
jgi:hypothetical protein